MELVICMGDCSSIAIDDQLIITKSDGSGVTIVAE